MAILFVFVAWFAGVIGYWVLAFSSDSTAWWWWFTPFYGTVKIFSESVGLGALQLGLAVVLFVLVAVMAAVAQEA